LSFSKEEAQERRRLLGQNSCITLATRAAALETLSRETEEKVRELLGAGGRIYDSNGGYWLHQLR